MMIEPRDEWNEALIRNVHPEDWKNPVAAGKYDLIVGDAYSGDSVPWHLTTLEVIAEFARLLRDDGIYMMNVIDSGESRFARAQLATLRKKFDQIAMVEPQGGIPHTKVNQILVASDIPIPTFDIDAADGTLVLRQAAQAYIGDDALVLTDNFAPADQLLR